MSGSNNTIPDGFRVIPGFPRYAVDDNGTVLSVCPRSGRGKNIPWDNARTVTHVVGRKGYRQVSLCGSDGIKNFHVHVLVLKLFSGQRPDGYQCRHLDGNKANNHISNLRWGTNSENERDKILHGTSNHGERHSMAKLTTQEVAEIRRRRASGELLKDIASDFSVSVSTISRIALRKHWQNA